MLTFLSLLYQPALQNTRLGVGNIFTCRCYNMQDCSTRCLVKENSSISILLIKWVSRVWHLLFLESEGYNMLFKLFVQCNFAMVWRWTCWKFEIVHLQREISFETDNFLLVKLEWKYLFVIYKSMWYKYNFILTGFFVLKMKIGEQQCLSRLRTIIHVESFSFNPFSFLCVKRFSSAKSISPHT